jgi:hypothetical protein
MPSKGYKQSPAHRAKTVAVNCGRKHSPEHNTKIADANRGLNSGVNNGHWKGGRLLRAGYVLLHRPDHPFAADKGYVREHRLVMEAHLGRTLLPTEVVHHINGIPDDNRIENLMRFDSPAEHQKWHGDERRK